VELENKMLDLKVPQDSESGICIDLRDRSDVSDTDLLTMMRLGKDETSCWAQHAVC
jgi:F-box and WD-40 domain protein 1/11